MRGVEPGGATAAGTPLFHPPLPPRQDPDQAGLRTPAAGRVAPRGCDQRVCLLPVPMATLHLGPGAGSAPEVYVVIWWLL